MNIFTITGIAYDFVTLRLLLEIDINGYIFGSFKRLDLFNIDVAVQISADHEQLRGVATQIEAFALFVNDVDPFAGAVDESRERYVSADRLRDVYIDFVRVALGLLVGADVFDAHREVGVFERHVEVEQLLVARNEPVHRDDIVRSDDQVVFGADEDSGRVRFLKTHRLFSALSIRGARATYEHVSDDFIVSPLPFALLEEAQVETELAVVLVRSFLF